MIVHIAGSNNTIADALSRFQATRFHQLAPLAAPHLDKYCDPAAGTVPRFIGYHVRRQFFLCKSYHILIS